VRVTVSAYRPSAELIAEVSRPATETEAPLTGRPFDVTRPTTTVVSSRRASATE
jgi:hypothetical protein